MSDLPEPISVHDKLLHNIADGTPSIDDIKPQCRNEVYLKYIAENGSGGGGDITIPVPIDQGGTGANTVTDAQKNLKWYSSWTQLGLEDGCAVSAIIKAMPSYSVFSASINDTDIVSGVPTSWGQLTIIKSDTRKMILYNRSLTDGKNGTQFYFGEDRGTYVTWYKVITTHPSSTVPVANGGTGSTTAANALINLGAASSVNVGDVSTLQTTAKTVVGAINELYDSINS